MKIAVCGKGGSGKSSVTALLARQFHQMGYRVLVIDADESNTGLYRLLGTAEPHNLLDHLGGKKAFKQKINQSFEVPGEALFGKKLTTDSLPAECVVQNNGISLLSVGKIHHAGEGCACSLGLLSKTVLSRLELAPGELVLIDTEAGVEHFGRNVDTGCDLILTVIDPVFESFTMAQRIESMAQTIGLDVYFILNKSDKRTGAIVEKHVSAEKIIARLPYNESLFFSNLEGTPLETVLPEIEPAIQLMAGRYPAARKTP